MIIELSMAIVRTFKKLKTCTVLEGPEGVKWEPWENTIYNRSLGLGFGHWEWEKM